MPSPWTPALNAELQTLWTSGLSYSQIADVLHLTRNAVARKCIDLNLRRGTPRGARPPKTLLPDAIAKVFNPQRTRIAAPRPGVTPIPDLPAPLESSRNVPIIALAEHDCRFPTSSTDSLHLFCGASAYTPPDRETPHPYCEAHCKIAYRPMQNPWAI